MKCARVTDDQLAAFDLPFLYKLYDVCDTPNYDLRKLIDGESVSAGRPFDIVNHYGKSRHESK